MLNANDETADPTTFADVGTVYFADSCTSLAAAAAAGEVAMHALARGHYPGEPFPAPVLPEIRSLGYWDAQASQSWGLDWHRNEGIEITYLAHGNVHFSVGQNDWELQPGSVTVTRPWQQHRVGNPNIGPSQLHWLILDVGVRRPHQSWNWPSWIALAPSDLARLTVLLQHNEYAVWQGNAALERSFVQGAALVADPLTLTFESETRIAVSSILLELLKTLESNHVELDDSLCAPRRGVSVFLDDLDAHLDRAWTVGTMARACDMGRTQFTQLCHDVTNTSPMNFLSTRRLSRAAQLLRESSMQVTEISVACGFETPQYFATRFKREYGQTPSAYRSADVHYPALVDCGRA